MKKRLIAYHLPQFHEIKEDENGNKGLNELSFHFLELVKQNIAYEVHNSMVIGSLTTEFLVQLFAKEKGVYVVMDSVLMVMKGKDSK